jgi:hypothetical protein
MFLTTINQVIRNWLSILLLTAVLVTSFLVSPQPASSTTTLTLPVRVEDSAEIPLPGFEIEFCHEGSGEWVCDTTAASDANGEAVISLSLPNDTGFVQLSAGGYPSEYSRTWTGVSYVEGVASVHGVPTPQPVLTLDETDWITTSVTVLNEISQPVRNEWVRISTEVPGFGDTTWTMSYWAETNDSGVATFHLDIETWGGERSITAEVGAMGHGSHAPASSPVTIVNLVGTSTINTRSLSFTLSGVVKDNLDQPMSNTDLCLLYRNFSTEKTVEVDFSTSSDGSYSIPGIKSTMVHFKPQACDLFDEDLNYDFQTWYELDEITDGYVQGSDITFNPKFTKTGIRVRVVNDQDVPLAFVTVGLEAQPMGEFEYRRQAVTNQEGIAYFSSLNPETDYEISHKLSDRPQDAQRFEDKTNPELTPTLATNTIVDAELVLVPVEFPPTPVTVSGRLLDENDDPISNGFVQINSSFGPGFSNYLGFRARTDSDGLFSVSDLPYGQIHIEASAKGHRPLSTYFEASSDGGDTYELGDFRLRASASGNLQYSGVLRDTTGQPIANMELVLNTPYEAGGSVKKVDTDAQGRFSFDGLTPGHHWLYANSNWDEYEWTSWNFNLNTSRQASLVLVGRGMTAPQSDASISGRVFEYLDVEGRAAASPIVGYCVDVFPVEGGTVTRGTTDDDGYWTATGLSEGKKYFIGRPNPCDPESDAEPSYDFRHGYELPQASSTIVTAIASGDTRHEWVYREVSQTGPGSISGRVRDGEDYTNLAGVAVNIERKNGGVTVNSVTTDPRGEYEFTNLPAGEYILNIGGTVIGDQEYWDTWSTVEVTTEANRVNLLLYKVAVDSGEGSEDGGAWNGVVSGTVLDENGRLHGSARVEVCHPDEAYCLATFETKNDGFFEIGFLPKETDLILKIVPWWSEIAVTLIEFFIDESGNDYSIEDSVTSAIENIRLEPGTSVSGQVMNIPQGVEVRAIFAELLDAETGAPLLSSRVDLETGQYVMRQVPDGSYKLRFTQNPRGGWSEFVQNSISMKPVYWDDTEDGTKNITEAQTVIVSDRVPVTQKDVTYSEGAVLEGTVSIATQNGPVPLTGSRSLWVDLFRKNSSGEGYSYFTSTEVSASTNYKFQFVGLAGGDYKISFADSRSGNNSLIWNFNGGAPSLEEAIRIPIDDGETKFENHTMEVAPPEMSAEAFDLDDLGAERLAELVNEISIPENASSGSELDIFVGTEFSGEFVSAFANSTPVLLGDWRQVNAEGYITVSIPLELPEGSHRIAVQDAKGVVFGWAPLSVVDADSGSSGTANVSPDSQTPQTVEEKKEDLDDDLTTSSPNQSQEAGSSGAGNLGSINETLMLLLIGFVSVTLFTVYWYTRSRRGVHSRR